MTKAKRALKKEAPSPPPASPSSLASTLRTGAEHFEPADQSKYSGLGPIVETVRTIADKRATDPYADQLIDEYVAEHKKDSKRERKAVVLQAWFRMLERRSPYRLWKRRQQAFKYAMFREWKMGFMARKLSNRALQRRVFKAFRTVAFTMSSTTKVSAKLFQTAMTNKGQIGVLERLVSDQLGLVEGQDDQSDPTNKLHTEAELVQQTRHPRF